MCDYRLKADSGFDLDMYRDLAAEAPILLMDARSKASSEHASFEELLTLGEVSQGGGDLDHHN